MTNPEDKIEQLGLILPAPKSAVANYLPYTQTGNLLLISGQGISRITLQLLMVLQI